MKVLLVHASPLDRLGGAELSLASHVAGAPEGVVVDVVLPHEDCDLSAYEAVVLANLRPQGGLGEDAELAEAVRWTQRLKGYRGFTLKSERDVHPCGRRDGRCLATRPFRKLNCGCSPRIRQAFEHLYNACSAVQFLSPAHQQAIRQLVQIRRPQYVIAPPVDLSRFRSRVPWNRRKRSALILGDEIRVAPTAEELATRNGYRPERVPYLAVPFERMPDLYNEYQAVVVAPVMFHAFGRVAVEAQACGCRVLANDRVGALSWPDPQKACRQANDQFWRLLEKFARRSSWRRRFSTAGLRCRPLLRRRFLS